MTTAGAPPEVPAPFPVRRVWWLACGFLAIQLVFALYNAFLPLLYREFLDSRAVVGVLMGTDNLVGLALIPVVGAWSDRVSSPLGRRLPFVVVALPVAALAFAGIPLAAATLWTLVVTEVVFTIAMHAFRGPMAAMILDHTPPSRRSTASGIAQQLGIVGVVVSFTVLAPLFDVDRRVPFAVGALVLLVALVVVWGAAQRHPPHVDNVSAGAAPLRDTLGGLAGLLRPAARGRLLVFGSLLVAYVGYAGLQAMFPLFGVEALGLTEGRAGLMLTAFAGAFLLSAFVAGVIGTRVGTVPAMQSGLAVLPIIYLAAAPLRSVTAVAVVLVLAGLTWPLFAVPAVALAANLDGPGRIGFLVGVYYVFTMTGQLLGPAIVGAVMDVVGNGGMWVAASGVTLVALILLRAGSRRLGV